MASMSCVLFCRKHAYGPGALGQTADSPGTAAGSLQKRSVRRPNTAADDGGPVGVFPCRADKGAGDTFALSGTGCVIKREQNLFLFVMAQHGKLPRWRASGWESAFAEYLHQVSMQLFDVLRGKCLRQIVIVDRVSEVLVHAGEVNEKRLRLITAVMPGVRKM